MAFETKEEVLERILAQDKPVCPHCKQEMTLWEVPPVAFGDGLGWGTPYLYVCFNDECPMYTKGWENIQEHFGHTASYRCMCYPGSENYECMPVFSAVGGKGQVIDDQVLMEQEVLKENTKRGFSILADCYVAKDGVTVMRILTDVSEPARVRMKAAEMIGDISGVEVIDALRSIRFPNDLIQEQVNKSIEKIHERHFTRECPFCAEIIKQRAKVCKHCGKDVAGE